MAIEGPLRELGIQDVLQLLDLAHKTGVLTVRSDRLNDEAIIHFHKGSIVFAVRRRSTRRLGQLLLRAGQITERELERALELQRTDPTRRLAEILLEMGSVRQDELEHQLCFQMEETVHELMAWDEGYFKFEERTALAQQRLLGRLKVESILMEGARRLDEWDRLRAKVASPEAVPVLAAAVGEENVPLELHPEEWEVLAEIDGERDIRQLGADLARSAFDVAKIVFNLASAGVVEVRERPSQVPELYLQSALEEVGRLVVAGEAERAQKLAAELEVAYPDRPDVALATGQTLLAQRRVRAAADAFNRAAALDPLSSDAHFQLGFAALRAGELDRAVRALETCSQLTPQGERRDLVARALEAAQSLNLILERVSK